MMKTKIDKFEDCKDWENWIGLEVIKHSKKPFKGGKQIEIVEYLTTNSFSGKQAFILNDESIVDCHQVKKKINNMTAREILQNLSTLDLIIISEELNEEFIPLDAKVRKVASDIYYIGSNETTLVMLIGLGTLIAYELSQRIKNNNI